MADLRGAVPPYYRDVYDALCPTDSEFISQTTLTQLLVKSRLDKNVLSQIWTQLDIKNGTINRSNMYKALALIAFAQNGKSISEKLIENFSGEELPRPDLGDVETLKLMIRQTKTSPTQLNYTYEEMCSFDTIQVELMPEKKGIFLKHSEYEVSSKRNNCTVKRRYKDFEAFHEILQQLFPYRIIPKLPPKKMINSDREFIEARRKSLRRFLNITSCHPAMYDSQVLQFFLTYNGEIVHKIKEKFRGVPDEFVSSPLASNAKELVPPETSSEFAASKEQINQLSKHVHILRDIATRIAERSRGNSTDMNQFGKELIAIGNDTSVTSQWAVGGNGGIIDTLKKSFRTLSVEFSSISEKHSLQNIREEEGVVEQLNMLHDLLQAYKDLCDRHERGVLKDHHYALKKYGAMKTKRMAATITNMEQHGVDRMDSRIQAQENEIATRESRNYFSLHCIHLESQLVYINMKILADVITTLVATQMKGHTEMAKLWEELAPRVTGLLPKNDKS